MKRLISKILMVTAAFGLVGWMTLTNIQPVYASGIVFDSVNYAFTSGGNTTAALTCSDTNEIVFAGVGAAIAAISVTWNGTAMTEIGTPEVHPNSGTYISLWYLAIGTGTGSSKTLAVSTTGGTSSTEVYASCYGGVNQSTPIDQSAYNQSVSNSATSYSPSLTTTVANDWMVGNFGYTGWAVTTTVAGANTYLRGGFGEPNMTGLTWIDTNAALATPGTDQNNITFTNGLAWYNTSFLAAIEPVATGGATIKPQFLMFN